jgi:hypothetical protein
LIPLKVDDSFLDFNRHETFEAILYLTLHRLMGLNVPN